MNGLGVEASEAYTRIAAQRLAERVTPGWLADLLSIVTGLAEPPFVRDLRVPLGGMKQSGVGRKGGDLPKSSSGRGINTAAATVAGTSFSDG